MTDTEAYDAFLQATGDACDRLLDAKDILAKANIINGAVATLLSALVARIPDRICPRQQQRIAY